MLLAPEAIAGSHCSVLTIAKLFSSALSTVQGGGQGITAAAASLSALLQASNCCWFKCTVPVQPLNLPGCHNMCLRQLGKKVRRPTAITSSEILDPGVPGQGLSPRSAAGASVRPVLPLAWQPAASLRSSTVVNLESGTDWQPEPRLQTQQPFAGACAPGAG